VSEHVDLLGRVGAVLRRHKRVDVADERKLVRVLEQTKDASDVTGGRRL
jgi:hypothetical protein